MNSANSAKPPVKAEVEVLALEVFGSVLTELGLSSSGRGARWTTRQHDLWLWLVIDSKASDPYRGGAFTLEVERSGDARFMSKLAGRARLGQLLTSRERAHFVTVHNALAADWPMPPEDHLALIPPSLRGTYLSTFAPVADLPANDLWLRYVTHGDLSTWLGIVRACLPDVVARAQDLEPHTLYLGKSLQLRE